MSIYEKGIFLKEKLENLQNIGLGDSYGTQLLAFLDMTQEDVILGEKSNHTEELYEKINLYLQKKQQIARDIQGVLEIIQDNLDKKALLDTPIGIEHLTNKQRIEQFAYKGLSFGMDLPEYGYPRKSLIQKNIDNDIIKIESIQDEIIPPNIRIAKILTQLDIKNTNKLNALTLKQNNNKYYANTKQITKYQYEELKKLQGE